MSQHFLNVKNRLEQLLGELESKVKNLEATYGQANDEIQTQMDDARGLLEMLRLDMPRSEEKETYKTEIRKLARRLRQLRSSMDWIQNNPKDHTDVIQHGRLLQDESLAALQRMVSTVADTSMIATQVGSQLDAQTRQIAAQQQALQDIQEQQHRAQRTIRRIARGRAVQAVSATVVGAAAVAVGLKFS